MIHKKLIGQLLVAFCLTLLSLVLVDKTPGNAQSSVDYVFTSVPGSAVELNSTFDIVVEVQAGSESIAGAEIYLDFDPTVLNVTGLHLDQAFNSRLWARRLIIVCRQVPSTMVAARSAIFRQVRSH